MSIDTWACSLPWTGFSNDPDGKVRPCCIFREHITDEKGDPYYVQTSTIEDIFHSKYMCDLRQQFRNGLKPTHCETCIVDESNKITSKRQIYNSRGYDIETEPLYPIEYQMILSNACNLKCRSCTPSHSSTWQAEHKILFGTTGYKMPHSQPGNQNSVLWTNRSEWISHIERLEIVGGEPFYTNQWQELWKELVNLGYSNKISMDMSTNCTIYSGDILREIIPSFSRIGLGLSIDGMGAVYDYLRHPGKWEEVNQNILKYYKLTKEFDGKFTIAIANTISWVNAWTLPELFQWTQQNMPGIKMWNNIVHWPKHLSLIMLPESAKNKIESKWRNTDWGEYSATVDGIINFMNSEQPSDEEIKNQYKNVIIHDLHRNESIVKIIPVELITDLNKYFI